MTAHDGVRHPGGTDPAPFTGWVSDLAASHARPLAAVARREGLTQDDALDAVQEAFHTFLTLPQARTLVDDADGSRRLLSVLVRNAARNMRRRHFRARPHDDLSDHEGLAEESPSVDETLARAEDEVRLLGCVSKLTDLQRHVVTLRMLHELSGEATAARLGLTPGHVAVLLHRAKGALLQCVGGGDTALRRRPGSGARSPAGPSASGRRSAPPRRRP